MATLTVYPDADPESATVDGMVQVNGVDLTWAGIISAAGVSADDSITNSYVFRIYPHATTDHWQLLRRSIYLFDTSALTAGATISAAVMSIYGTAKGDDATAITPNVDIYTSTPASNTALVAADMAQLGSTSQTGSPISYASWSTSAYNDFTLNATGLGNINKTGITKFGARNANYDVAASAPTWSTAADHYMQGYFADQTGTTNDPKLVITYTATAGPANVKTYNGIAAASVKTIKGIAIASVKTWNGIA